MTTGEISADEQLRGHPVPAPRGQRPPGPARVARCARTPSCGPISVLSKAGLVVAGEPTDAADGSWPGCVAWCGVPPVVRGRHVDAGTAVQPEAGSPDLAKPSRGRARHGGAWCCEPRPPGDHRFAAPPRGHGHGAAASLVTRWARVCDCPETARPRQLAHGPAGVPSAIRAQSARPGGAGQPAWRGCSRGGASVEWQERWCDEVASGRDDIPDFHCLAI